MNNFDYRACRKIFDQEYLKLLYAQTGGRVNEAARISGISKVTLIRRTKALGVDRHKFQLETLQKDLANEKKKV